MYAYVGQHVPRLVFYDILICRRYIPKALEPYCIRSCWSGFKPILLYVLSCDIEK